METFSPTSLFRSVDFPELGRPIMETKPDLLIRLGNKQLQTQTLDTPPVGVEHFDLDAAVLDLFTSRRQTSEEFHYGARNSRAVRIRNKRDSEFLFKSAEFQTAGNNEHALAFFE